MKLTTYTDFGLRALMYLATLPRGELTSVARVSALYDVSRNHMVKVINQLAREGYVEALRGKNGGIRLARAPRDINAGKVIRLLEHNLRGIDCGSPACPLVPACRLRDALAEAMEAFLQVMEGYTLADLVDNRKELMVIFSTLEADRRPGEPAA
ncbi:Rrf2 family transcriptional regulator [Oceanimonas sp. NS1]|uniref:Transcriptional repressor NsrR n=1 Tax=Oceanimonas doudoroffii TaxID=84158 RepID=A0A233RCJ1_9GAMM|nr:MULTISPECIES: Rrf2 family transcriptional regulator [Oceanimonas]MCT7654964.1 Rrf2 family transcriptional regulator [Oceanimonas sp. NS1]NHI00935.1 HTH-type transcriptional repressor NsrR [Oceanimonas sp. MB9]OXY81100.1 transcriptional repressor NsrR [Oceanimonas doudoroffii]